MSSPFAHGLKVVVFTCGDLGYEVASLVRQINQIRQVTVIQTPYVHPRRSFRRKIAHIYRMEGMVGIAKGAVSRLKKGLSLNRPIPFRETERRNLEGLEELSFRNFHDEACLRAICELQPDLGVVAGTYILRPEVFSAPRLGSINLHSGKVPEYRGAAPAFWELYNGESEVGITIHWVSDKLDAGDVLAQETFALNSAPPGDPLQYLDDFRSTVLRPNGVRMLCEAVARIASGDMRSQPQPVTAHRTFPSPDHEAKKELLRRVARRREGKVL